MTDDEIMAAALRCPESEKVPLKVGDRVIALKTFCFWGGVDDIKKGEHGIVSSIRRPDQIAIGLYPIAMKWDSCKYDIGGLVGPIGKLVPRK